MEIIPGNFYRKTRRVMVMRVILGCLALGFAASCFGQTLCPKHIETPIYPPLARAARVQAKVTLKVTIDRDGNVTNIADAGDPAHQAASVLQKSAIENMQHWTFERPAAAPFTQIIVYQYRFDGSLPVNDYNHPITKVNIDLPDRVTILANELVANPGQSKSKKLKSRVP